MLRCLDHVPLIWSLPHSTCGFLVLDLFWGRTAFDVDIFGREISKRNTARHTLTKSIRSTH